MSVTQRKWTYKAADGTVTESQAWQVFVRGTRPDGKEIIHRRVLRGITKPKAVEEEARVREAVRTGTYRTDDEVKAEAEAAKARMKPEPTVQEFWEQDFIPHAKTNNRISEQTNKERTGQYILPLVGHRKLKDIGTRELEAIKTALLSRKPALKAKTVKNHLMTFKRCLKFACEVGVIDHVPYVKPVKVPAPAFRHLTPEETDKLVAAAEKEWKAMILTAARTGLRIGELLALTWADVDLKIGQVTVSKSLFQGKGTLIIQPTKTNLIRYVPLEPELLEVLKEHRKKTGGSKNVFCHPNGSPFTRFEARRPLDRAAKNAGLKPFGWHVLRHTFASQLVIKGATLHDVQELLGHTTMTMTLRYAHLNDERKRSVVGLLSSSAVTAATK